jgi:hypothetical protein
MKCVAIAMLSVGAFAVQDTTPPVISLTLAGAVVDTTTEDGTSAVDGHAHHAHSCAVWTTADGQSVCPDPSCSTHDHHDGAGVCERVVTNINNDNDATDLLTVAAGESADKNVRSMWLYSYNAEDASGNKAETVTFELTMYDHKAPSFTITRDIFTDAKKVESCNNGAKHTPTGAPYFLAAATPCTWTIPKNTATANDNYDLGVNDRITSGMSSVSAAAAAASLTPNADRDINTQNTGKRYFHWKVCDKAGQYGEDGTDNCEEESAETTIVDTTPPVMTVHNNEAPVTNGANNWYECKGKHFTGAVSGSTYIEHNAMCQDLADSWVDGAYDNNAMDVAIDYSAAAFADGATAGDGVTTNLVGDYTVTYTCQDKANTAEQKKTRSVQVEDTTAPVITLTGDTIVENSAGAHVSTEAGTMDTGLFAHGAMHDAATCVDACYSNPTITSTLHYGACEASMATANLVGDGKLSGFPEYTAGDYSVIYVCTDPSAAKHTATTCRTIRNVDHTKPVIQILGSDNMTLEATHEGNYIDDGATCSDQVDGVISQNVEVSGDVVNLSKVGSYTITYNCKDSAGNAAPTLNRNVNVAQTSCPTCQITGEFNELKHEASFPYTDEGAVCTDIIDGTVKTHVRNPVNVQVTGKYVITYRAVNSVGLWNDGKNADGTADGTGCRGTAISYTRTVVVSDTLKPVIKLTYPGSGTIAWGAARHGDKSVSENQGHPENPFGAKGEHNGLHGQEATEAEFADAGFHGNAGFNKAGHQAYMAEEQTSSVNGWVLGAIASAVTGLALLGYSQRKTTVATSVPV